MKKEFHIGEDHITRRCYHVDKDWVGLEKCSQIVVCGEKLKYWKIEEKSSGVTRWMRQW
jgi:hypothetical protein